MNSKTFSTQAIFSCVLWFLCSFDKGNKKEQIENKSYDVIIVPGVPYSHPSYKIVMKSRMLWAKYLYKKGIAKNIIFSGSSVYTPYVEGDIMKMYANGLGIPEENTFSETQAEHSTENVYYSLLLAKKLGFKKIAVATDPYQAIVIRKFIKKNCPEIDVVKIDYDKINLLSPLPTINPSSAFVKSFVSLTERESRFKRFKGTLGKNIKLDMIPLGIDKMEAKVDEKSIRENFVRFLSLNDSICTVDNCEAVVVR